MLELRFIQKPDVSKLGALDIDALKSTLPPMSKREKGVAVAFIVLIIMWVFPQTIMKIPGLEAFGSMLNNLGTYAPPLLIIAVGKAAEQTADADGEHAGLEAEQGQAQTHAEQNVDM